MILVACTLLFLGGDEEKRTSPQSALARELGSHAVKLSKAKGLAKRIEELAAVVSRLTEALGAASQSSGRTEDSVVLSKLALTLVDEGLVPRLREVSDDDPRNDAVYAGAVDAATRACDQARAFAATLPEDQRQRFQPNLDSAAPKVKRLSDWITERMARRDKPSNPGARGDRSPGAPDEVSTP